MLDTTRSDLTVGLVGSGVMGRGIAQIAASGGCRVLVYDARAGAAAEARSFVGQMLGKLAEKGKMPAEHAAAAAARVEVVDSPTGLAACHVVIEAIVENLEAKRALFAELEAIVGDDSLLATNTSSLSVTAIAAQCRRPERVGGFHFFNPVPLMKIVEVIEGELSAPWVAEALTALARRMGHTPVRAKDTPGFIVNHAGRGFGTEALRILQEGVADYPTVDRIMREAAGFRMGPFELLDLTGLDVSHPVMESIYEQFYHEPRFRPSPITRQRLIAGLLGRKSGRGFYDYREGAAAAAAPPVPEARPVPVWLAPGAEALTAVVAKHGARIETGDRPSAEALILVAPLGEDASAATVRLGLDPARVVAVDPMFGLESHRTLMASPATRREMRDAAHGLFASDGVPVSVVRDSPGFVAQRVVATIVNIGCDIAQQRIAAPADVDRAVTLGLGYPKGPLAWGDALGPTRVLAVLEAMQALTGDPRYRPSAWLRRRATLGLSLLTDD
jgi:3-hydroxybutyryl-CoA dehydrogenase